MVFETYHPLFALPPHIRTLGKDPMWTQCYLGGHVTDPPIALPTVQDVKVTSRGVPAKIVPLSPGLTMAGHSPPTSHPPRPPNVPHPTGGHSHSPGLAQSIGNPHSPGLPQSTGLPHSPSLPYPPGSPKPGIADGDKVITASDPSITIGSSTFQFIADPSGNGGVALVLGSETTIKAGDPATLVNGNSVSVGRFGVVVGDDVSGKTTFVLPSDKAGQAATLINGISVSVGKFGVVIGDDVSGKTTFVLPSEKKAGQPATLINGILVSVGRSGVVVGDDVSGKTTFVLPSDKAGDPATMINGNSISAGFDVVVGDDVSGKATVVFPSSKAVEGGAASARGHIMSAWWVGGLLGVCIGLIYV